MIEGEKRYVRHVDFTGPGNENIKTKLIYDYRKEFNTVRRLLLLTKLQLVLSTRKCLNLYNCICYLI